MKFCIRNASLDYFGDGKNVELFEPATLEYQATVAEIRHHRFELNGNRYRVDRIPQTAWSQVNPI